MKFRMLAVAAAMALSAGAHAASPVFSDDFQGYVQGTNATLAPTWATSGGTIDVVPVGDQFHFLSEGNGNYVDLDGSSFSAGTITHTITGLADGEYALTFELAGNHRNDVDEHTLVTIGATGTTIVSHMNDDAWYTVYGVASGGSLTISFHDMSSDNIGSLLDNVSVSAVPEPGNVALMLAGLAALGAAARRRRGH